MGRSQDEGFTRLGSIAEIPDEEIRSFELHQGRVAVATLDGRLYAFADSCTHQGCLLSEGTVSEQETVVCPEDGSEFDMNTGEPVHGPGEDPIPVYPVRVRLDWIEVALP